MNVENPCPVEEAAEELRRQILEKVNELSLEELHIVIAKMKAISQETP